MIGKLLCDCERGYFHCVEACDLWEEANVAHRRAIRSGYDSELWQDYEKALERYWDHFMIPEAECQDVTDSQ